jgi:hypothetical protein
LKVGGHRLGCLRVVRVPKWETNKQICQERRVLFECFVGLGFGDQLLRTQRWRSTDTHCNQKTRTRETRNLNRVYCIPSCSHCSTDPNPGSRSGSVEDRQTSMVHPGTRRREYLSMGTRPPSFVFPDSKPHAPALQYPRASSGTLTESVSGNASPPPCSIAWRSRRHLPAG